MDPTQAFSDQQSAISPEVTRLRIGRFVLTCLVAHSLPLAALSQTSIYVNDEATVAGDGHPTAAARSVVGVAVRAGTEERGIVDCNTNGIDDAMDIAGGTSADCNTNSMPDECDIAAGVVFRNSTVATSASATSLTIARPAGTSPNDILIAVLSKEGAGSSINAPDGWSLIDEGDTGGMGGQHARLGVFYHIAGTAEPDSYTMAWSGNDEAIGAILAYSGVNRIDPIDMSQFATGSSDTPTPPGVFAESDDSLILRIYGAEGDIMQQGPPGHDVRFSVSAFGAVSGSAADAVQPSAGDTGSAHFALSSSENWRAVTVVIRPVADCNANGVPDTCDTAAGTAQDCNDNGIPDECEVSGSAAVDCNNNGLDDCIDISLGTSQDCNTNGVLDECDVLPNARFESLTEPVVGFGISTTLISMPPGTLRGDLLLAIIARDGSNSLAASEWGLLFDGTTSGGAASLGVAYKIAVDSEPAKSFSWGVGQEYIAAILRYSGVDVVRPIDGITAGAGSNGSPTSPNLVTTVGNALVLRAYVADGSDLALYPGSHTGRFRTANGTAVNAGAADTVQVLAGATGTAVFSQNPDPLVPWRTVTIALRPGPSTDFDGNETLDECELLPARLYVDQQAAGTGDGSSWTNAMTRLQAALGLARVSSGRVAEIWVADGTYKPSQSGDRSATFELVSGVGVYGGFAGNETALDQRDPATHVTALSGDIGVSGNTTDNSYHVVNATGILGGSGLLGSYFNNIDFTDLRFARVDSTVNFNWGSGSPSSSIAADTFSVRWIGLVQPPTTGTWTFYVNTDNGVRLWVDDVPIIDHWVVSPIQESSGSIALDGGRNYSIRMEYFENLGQALAMLSWSGPGRPYQVIPSTALSQPNHLDGFTITGGNAAGAPANRGSGLLADPGAPRVARCDFSANTALNGAAAFASEFDTQGIALLDCLFRGNAAGGAGGAFQGTGTLLNCRFLSNSSDDGAGVSSLGNVSIINSEFRNNAAQNSGGAVYRRGGDDVTLINSTIVGNTAGGEGGGLFVESQGMGSFGAVVTNSILWQNVANGVVNEQAQIDDDAGRATVTYSLIQGLSIFATGLGNITGDPLFVDPEGADDFPGTVDDDLRLRLNSPCRDLGKNAALPADTFDLDGDGNINELTPLDLAGRDRAVDDPQKADCLDPGAEGTCGVPPIVDMGAFEGTLDCNANGFLDEDDIAFGTSEDCNGSLVPDECELSALVQSSSAPLGPIGAGSPRSYSLGAALPAAGDATLSFSVVADLSATDEWIDVTLGTILVGRIFEAGGSDCPEIPDTAQLSVTQADFNLALAQAMGDALVIGMAASINVNPNLCGTGSIAVSVSYRALANDCNQNGVLDECDIAAGTSQDLDADALPDECGLDCNNNGIADGIDLQVGFSQDCNSNGRPDECDIQGGDSLDCQSNGIPDECESLGIVLSRWVVAAGLWNCGQGGTPLCPPSWCPDYVPNNVAGRTFAVTIDGPLSVATLDISPAIDSLALLAGATLEVNSGSGAAVRSIAVAAPIVNDGTIRAADGVRLLLDAANINQSPAGVIEAVGGPGEASKIQILGRRVTGGTARTSGDAAAIELLGGAVLENVMVEGNVGFAAKAARKVESRRAGTKSQQVEMDDPQISEIAQIGRNNLRNLSNLRMTARRGSAESAGEDARTTTAAKVESRRAGTKNRQVEIESPQMHPARPRGCAARPQPKGPDERRCPVV